MDSKIIEKGDGWIGVQIIDNSQIKHKIAVSFDGDIQGHSQDRYPDDASKRTKENNENVNQAQRYARWHVYRERGYDTVPPTENPDRILATLLAITKLSDAAFDNHFGDLQTQIESHYSDTPVDLPFATADADDMIVYQKDIYIHPDPTEFEPPVLDQFLGCLEGDSDSPAVATKEQIKTSDFDELNFDIEAVSELHYLHTDGHGNEQTKRGNSPLDREPDTTIELIPFDPAEIKSFHHYVVSHLAYQIRDCFLRMGVKPPVAFRATGWGKYRAFHEQKFCPQYENYWDAEATIESWQPG